ncbi:hypothetical protein [Zooshikella sp. RANM57]|uniref:hypothetical protein n=1 Tax=Zooshikella sp. RANM57 TaxID=3425863 RepID=UPI003D6E1F09
MDEIKQVILANKWACIGFFLVSIALGIAIGTFKAFLGIFAFFIGWTCLCKHNEKATKAWKGE